MNLKPNHKKKDIIILISVIIILLVINYSFLDNVLQRFLTNYESVEVERVIDGDTFAIENTSVRLLGINTPERGELYYQEAKEFLENEILNKTVDLKYGKERYDKYQRTLAYVFLDNTNINLKLVENGFANYYFPSGKDMHYDEFKNAWEECVEKEINLCEASENVCAECIEIISRDTIVNTCSFSCDITGWQIKGEGRKKFIFSDEILEQGEEILFELELTDIGDTLFLRDGEGKLVLWVGV